jgi:hypothetical protein
MNAEKRYSEAAREMRKANYSERSIESMYDAERLLEDEMENKNKYVGMNQAQKLAAMQAECDEICEGNMIWDYYNN